MDWNWSQAGQGAAGGAMAGSFAGPLGSLVGAGLGGLLGGLGGGGASDYQSQLKALSEQYANRPIKQMGPAAQGNYSQYRQNQSALISQLEARARGEGPSAAALQMREAMDRAAGAQASAAAGAGGRGVNSGAALRNATNNTAAIQMQGARDTAVLRAQEQADALQQLGGVISQGRAADESMNQFNAGSQNQMQEANMQAYLQQLGLKDEGQLKALMAAIGVAGPGMGGALMAGGATAFPAAMQFYAARNPVGGGTSQMGSGGNLFGGFSRNGDGSLGPITNPNQV